MLSCITDGLNESLDTARMLVMKLSPAPSTALRSPELEEIQHPRLAGPHDCPAQQPRHHRLARPHHPARQWGACVSLWFIFRRI
eukprot:symbB.v1.2.020673.t1/scaffold1751.1/size103110/4